MLAFAANRSGTSSGTLANASLESVRRVGRRALSPETSSGPFQWLQHEPATDPRAARVLGSSNPAPRGHGGSRLEGRRESSLSRAVADCVFAGGAERVPRRPGPVEPDHLLSRQSPWL